MPTPTPVSLHDLQQLLLTPRPRDAHKGLFGHVLVIGGDYGMAGAVRLTGEAALRVGAGLVTVATHHEHGAIVSSMRPELMCHGINNTADLIPLLKRATVIALGPGLGQSTWSQQLFTYLINDPVQAQVQTQVQTQTQAKIVDADALNLLAQKPCTRTDWILTPHVGEAARLLNCTPVEIQHDRAAAALALQNKYGGIIVLKGAGTLIAGPNTNLQICHAGNPGMASAGMGDVLSGVIAGLVAQGLALNDAAALGVCIHAAAGDLAAAQGGERGMLAADLIAQLRSLVNPSAV